MTIHTASMEELIKPGVLKAIQTEVDAVCNEILEEGKARLEQRVAKVAAGVAVQLMEMVSFERMGHELLIRVKLEK